MARVRVEPASLIFDVGHGESLLDAATRAGIRWPTVCHGAGICTTCHCVIRSGHEHVSVQSEQERAALVLVRRRHPNVPEHHVRLACQTTVSGDAEVYCKGVRSGSPTTGSRPGSVRSDEEQGP